jgi:hypothetical protein
MFHRHQWVEVNRIFTKSRAKNFSGTGEEALDLWREAAFGITSIELRCECGEVTERRLLGDHSMEAQVAAQQKAMEALRRDQEESG